MEEFLRRYDVKTFFKFKPDNTKEVYPTFIFNKSTGRYEAGEDDIKGLIRQTVTDMYDDFNGDDLTEYQVNNVLSTIRSKTMTPLPKMIPLRIAFLNYTIEWNREGLRIIPVEERTGKDYAFYHIPYNVHLGDVDYLNGKNISVEDLEELAKKYCPKALKAFKDWVGDRWVTLFELVGYPLFPMMKFPKAFILIGDRSNGKTSFLLLLDDIYGDYSVTITPQELFNPDNRFAPGQLENALVNTVAEIKNFSFDDMDTFKRLTGGDNIGSDRKFKGRTKFRNTTKFIFATNNFPHVTRTDDDAFWERWIVLEFKNKFPRDASWYTNTFTREEIEGVITVAIFAMARVIQQHGFDYQQSIDEVKDIWLNKTDTVYEFVTVSLKEGRLILDTSDGNLETDRDEMYKLYMDYCSVKGYNGVGKKAFTRRLVSYFHVIPKRKNIHGVRPLAFVGIGINYGTEGSYEEYKGFKVVSQVDANLLDQLTVQYFEEYINANKGRIMTYKELSKDLNKDPNNDVDNVEKLLEFCGKRGLCRQVDTLKWKLGE